MANQATSKANGFVWYDVMTTDMKAAEKFYGNVFGWKTADSGMKDRPPYTLLSVGDTMIGGIMPIPPDAAKMGVQPAWMGYIGVSDIDAMVTRVKQAGGTIHRGPEDIPTVGRIAIVGDLHGAGFILFQPASDARPSPVAEGTPGYFGWHDLRAGNGAEAFAFYSKLFGWTKDHAIDMGPGNVYQIFAVDGVAVGGIATKQPAVPAPHWFYFINVDALDAATARVVKGGGKATMDAMQVPGGRWIIQCTDPQGAHFGMAAPKR